MSEGLVTFREGLEAALVVGILARVVPLAQRWLIGAGIGAAILMSLLAAWVISAIAATHALWEIGFSLLGAGLLLYMVGWMRRQGANLSHHLRATAQGSSAWMLFSMAFTAVAREGLETVLFLRALWSMQSQLSWMGGLLGLFVAMAVGFLVFRLGKRLPMKTFFTLSSVLLILIASGIAAYAVHEILEYGALRSPLLHEIEEAKAWRLFPPLSQPSGEYPWLYAFYEGQYFHPLHHKGYIGSVLHALIGWRASMSWVEIITWFLTCTIGLWWWHRNK
jgi:high-affinity iron transporter